MTEQLDQLTVFKASELRKQGYKDVGFVLQNEHGQIGVVAHAAVRWLHTPDEFFAFMHPDESQALQLEDTATKQRTCPENLSRISPVVELAKPAPEGEPK